MPWTVFPTCFQCVLFFSPRSKRQVFLSLQAEKAKKVNIISRIWIKKRKKKKIPYHVENIRRTFKPNDVENECKIFTVCI